MGITDDPDGVPPALHAAGKQRVIGQHGPHAGQNGPVAVPILMDPLSGRFPGDPFGCPGAGGDLSVHGHGVFQNHIGAAGGDEVEKYLVEVVAALLAHPGLHLDAVLPQKFKSFARHQRVWVIGAHHHAGNARVQNGLGAGRLAALMTAGLQCDIEGCSGGRTGTVFQRLPLRVEFSVPGVPPLSDDLSILHQNSSHHGIG